MKKFIVAIALMLSATTAFAGPKIGNWEVDYENQRIVNKVVETEFISNVVLSKSGQFVIFIYPREVAGSGFNPDDIVTKSENVVSVNGTRVNMVFEANHNNVMRIIAKSERGNDHIANEFWNKRKVSFLVNGQYFWTSAVGVQKAYRMMIEAGTAI